MVVGVLWWMWVDLVGARHGMVGVVGGGVVGGDMVGARYGVVGGW